MAIHAAIYRFSLKSLGLSGNTIFVKGTDGYSKFDDRILDSSVISDDIIILIGFGQFYLFALLTFIKLLYISIGKYLMKFLGIRIIKYNSDIKKY